MFDAGRTARPELSGPLVVLLFVVALGGRFSLSRVGGDWPADGDIRWVSCPVLVLATLLWRFPPGRPPHHNAWRPAVPLVCALILYQMVSAFWSAPGARLTDQFVNAVTLLCIVVCAAVIVRPDPVRAAEILLRCSVTAGLVYALAALATGPGAQDRYSAFAGGPNVFVRVVCLGIIGSVALAAARRRAVLLAPVPLLLVAAVLSGSRGGLVSLGMAGLALLLVLFRRLPAWKLAAVPVGATLVAVGLWKVVRADELDGLYARYSLTMLRDNDYSVRPQLLAEAWSIFVEHPVIGGGMDAFYVYSGQFLGIGYAHNYLASLAAEGGLVAVGILVTIVIALLRGGRPWERRPPVILGCLAGAVYVATASMFSGDYYDTRFMWIFAVVLLNRAGDDPRPTPVGSDRAEERSVRHAGGLPRLADDDLAAHDRPDRVQADRRR